MERGEDITDFDKTEEEWLDALGIMQTDSEDSDFSDESEESIETNTKSTNEQLANHLIDELSDYEDEIFDGISLTHGEYEGNLLLTISNLEKLKEKEKTLIEKIDSGYYRCKQQHKNAYEKICNAYSPYVTKEMLMMLHHPWSTQKNEALNKSVASYAPKDRTFSQTTSLDTRVGLAGATQVGGYLKLWKKIYESENMDVDENFSAHLRMMDTAKNNKNERAKTNKSKSRRSLGKYKKLKKAQELDRKAHKEGTEYASGVAIKKATKIVNLMNVTNHETHRGLIKTSGSANSTRIIAAFWDIKRVGWLSV